MDDSELIEGRVQETVVAVQQPAPHDAAHHGRHRPWQQDGDPEDPGAGECFIEKQRREQSENHHPRDSHGHERSGGHQRGNQVVAVEDVAEVLETDKGVFERVG